MTTRILLRATVIAGLLARGASAQSASPVRAAATPIGVWRGTSICLVRPSACNDEVVVYRITQMKAADSLAMDGRRIVNGEEQEMGVLTCSLVSPTAFTCALPQAVWQFSVRSDSLIGELRRRDNTKFRDVRAKRAP